MDVISMSQRGIENVVASSGTSLTEGQIRLIHRFTENVTVIYDSDPAGIKASLRGIDMLLREGMKIKVLLLPEGDDPDSFAQSHTLAEIEEYVDRNETDFIRFKTRILLEGAENDPIKRASAVSDIVKSIACIPDMISRIVYISECSRLLQIDEKVLKLEVEKQLALRIESADKENKRAENENRHVYGNKNVPYRLYESANQPTSSLGGVDTLLAECERVLLRYVLKFGAVDFCEVPDDNGNTVTLKLIEYVMEELAADNLEFFVPAFRATYDLAVSLFRESWQTDSVAFEEQLASHRQQMWNEGLDEIQQKAIDLADIKKQELALALRCDEMYAAERERFMCDYIEVRLASSPNDDVRSITTDLVSEKHQLSKVHTKFTKVEEERDRLIELVPKAIAGLKDAHLARLLKQERDSLSHIDKSNPDYAQLLQKSLRQIDTYTRLRMELARNLGERVIMPRR